MLEGTFIDGVPNGKCRWIWDDGKAYFGDIKNFQCHGQGFMRLAQNLYPYQKYEGQFYQGQLVRGSVEIED